MNYPGRFHLLYSDHVYTSTSYRKSSTNDLPRPGTVWSLHCSWFFLAWSLLVQHSTYLDIKYFTFNIKARDRKACNTCSDYTSSLAPSGLWAVQSQEAPLSVCRSQHWGPSAGAAGRSNWNFDRSLYGNSNESFQPSTESCKWFILHIEVLRRKYTTIKYTKVKLALTPASTHASNSKSFS